jgi:bifunctional UDP-N-acetylglucosamine pyrophosphorylase/glucosamine-1-phosphate N-acetyltransferase
MGDTSKIEILGKSMFDWVALALGDNPCTGVNYSDSVPLPALVRPYLDREMPYTAVLFSDTPLLTKKTVYDAVAELKDSGHNVLKLTRGYIFNTEYLSAIEKMFTDQTHYFDVDDFVTAFSFKQVGLISDILKNRILEYHMERGVQFEDMATAYVGCDVTFGKGVVIGPNNTLKGRTFIKDNVRIGPNCVIDNSIIEDGASVNASQIYKSYIGKGTSVGPFAYVRPESVIGPKCKIGDFVEIKKSVLGEGCKVSHLSYVGDAEIGSGCNIGCGVVFVNYDGKNKHKAKVGDNVFIGSNSNIIAPVTVKNGAFIAAGSTITDNVDENALAIARARQVIKPDWTGNKFTNK